MLTYPLVLGFWEIALIAIVIVLIIGGKKIPELLSGIGKGLKSFREGRDGVDEQENQAEKK
ncbi:MAG: twin-arginine translocase TatA/TatE family subunit [Bacteroidales bacterium]|nr:twin-arginine translocase TatA/TatE family subunit [Bacteroidales bacterium]